MANNFSFYLLSFLLPNLLVGNLDTCAGAVITSNSADSAACPGEELVYTCVSIGTSQIWLLRREGTVLVELIFTSGQSLGSQHSQSPFTFTLISTSYNNFVSTLSFVAASMLHNTRLECTGLTTPDSVTVEITGSPTAPQNLQSMVDDYHSNFSTVLFTWEAPNDNSRIDHYQYQLVNEAETLTYNTTNTSAIVSDIRYNRNVTFSLFVINCIGSSASVRLTVNIVGCRELDYYFFNINSSTFSQAPGTQLLLQYNVNREEEEFITITCQDNGHWQPDPSTLMCFVDVRETPYGTSSPKQDRTFLLVIYVLTAIVANVLCIMLAGITATCIWRQGRNRKELSATRRANDVYDEIINFGPVCETPSVCNNMNHVTMTSNEAYKSSKWNFTSNLLEVDLTNNEAYALSLGVNDNHSNKSNDQTISSVVATCSGALSYEEHSILRSGKTTGMSSNYDKSHTIKQDKQKNMSSSSHINDQYKCTNENIIIGEPDQNAVNTPAATLNPQQDSTQTHTLSCEQHPEVSEEFVYQNLVIDKASIT